ncbi:hypothetical protein ACQKWADRAFT_132758 [Trichoderma austrokoningii]
MLSQNLQAMQQSSPANGANTQEQHLRAQLELLQDHDPATSSASNPSARDSRGPLSRPPNGYDVLAASHDVARPVLAKLDAEAHIHPDLRASIGHAPAPNMMPMGPPPGHSPITAGPGPSAVPLAPAPPPQMAMDGADSNDGRKAKRELSQSKRAAQNRAAQRAFRQRKEGYIKKLEQQVRELAELEHSYKSMQSENYALREYVIHLQSRLLDTQGEFPPPPPNVNLSQPSSAVPPPPSAIPEQQHQQQHQQQQHQHQAPPPPQQQPPNSGSSGVGTPLEAVAQAVAGLTAQEQMVERSQTYPSPPFKSDQPGERDGNSHPAPEDLSRQLNPEERPTQA